MRKAGLFPSLLPMAEEDLRKILSKGWAEMIWKVYEVNSLSVPPHAHWLEDVIQKVRNLGKRDLTVGEFKTMTGLSRKYAIPLLELLDRMGVTRRKGTGREIL